MTRGERVIAFIEKYCVVPEGDLVGKPMRLEGFQKDFIVAIYDNPQLTYKAILSIGRKNGKTGLIAAILLVHLVGPEAVQNTQIVSGAMSREQAALVFNLAVKMIGLNPILSEIIHIIPSGKRLIGKPCNVEYRALAAEGKTAQGLSPVLAILDEVGQVAGAKNAFIDAIVTAQGAYTAPLLIAISTQAANDADLLSIWIDDAKTSKDPHIVCHLYQTDAEAPLTDTVAWKASNPALGTFRSIKDMERLAEQAQRMPSFENTFRNLNLNQRVSTVSPFISLNVWKACGDKPTNSPRRWFGGLDLSARNDLTSLVLVGEDEHGVFDVIPFFWTPEKTLLDRAKSDRAPYDVWVREGVLRTTPGVSVDYSFVVKDIGELMATYDIESIAFDRWRIDILKREADAIGLILPLVEFGQGFRDMAPAIDTVETLMLNGRMRHGMHPVLTMCAANAVVIKDSAGNRKLDKSKSTGRIDGMVAKVMATRLAKGEAVNQGDAKGFFDDPIIVGVS